MSKRDAKEITRLPEDVFIRTYSSMKSELDREHIHEFERMAEIAIWRLAKSIGKTMRFYIESNVGGAYDKSNVFHRRVREELSEFIRIYIVHIAQQTMRKGTRGARSKESIEEARLVEKLMHAHFHSLTLAAAAAINEHTKDSQDNAVEEVKRILGLE